MENENSPAEPTQGGRYISVVIFLFVIALVAGIYLLLNKGSSNQSLQTPTQSANITAGEESGEALASPSAKPIMDNVTELQIIDELVGTGAAAESGKKVVVNYTGTLTDGTIFDSNVNPKFGHVEPFSFTLGVGEVIPGWDQGVAGMKVGGKRKLTIPPSLGYGSQDMGVIPPNSTLIFEVELLKVE